MGKYCIYDSGVKTIAILCVSEASSYFCTFEA